MPDIERIYTIPLRSAKNVPRWKRANSAVKKLKEQLSRHLKVDKEEIKIDSTINEKIWARGSMKPPSKIRIRVVKFEKGGVETELAS